MGTPRRVTYGRRRIAAAAAACIAYAVMASFTRPFTWPADVVTAVPLVLAAVATVPRMRRAGAAGAAGHVAHRARASGWRWLVPVAVAVAVAGWELACYASAPRAAHPTLSSLIDLLDSTHAGKAVAFAVWLALGWYLVAP